MLDQKKKMHSKVQFGFATPTIKSMHFFALQSEWIIFSCRMSKIIFGTMTHIKKNGRKKKWKNKNEKHSISITTRSSEQSQI